MKRTRITATLAALAILVGTQAAFATTTLSVDGATSPAGPVSMSMTTGAPSSPGYLGLVRFESDYGVWGTCDQTSLDGYVLKGASGGVGTKIGAITETQFVGCSITGWDWLQQIVKNPIPDEWTIHLDETPAKGQRFVQVEIRNVSAQMHAPLTAGPWTCAINLSGNVKATIVTGPNSRLVINTPSLSGAALQYPLLIDALDAWGNDTTGTLVSCGGEYQDGDKMSLVGTFQLDREIEVS